MNIYHKYKNWGYKNTALLIASLILLILFSSTTVVVNIINKIGSFGYISAFFAGFFFVSIFTVAPASIVLFDLANKLNPILVTVIAGAGSVLGDYIIFKFLKDKVFEELKPMFSKISLPDVFLTTFRTPYFSWIIPMFGAFIIASPLPDEIGVCMLGLSKVKRYQFILITFLLNTAGILLITVLASTF